MLKRETNGVKVLLVDWLTAEDIAMVQATYSRSAAGAETHLTKLLDARREAVREALLRHTRAGDREAPNEAIDDVLEVLTGAATSARAGRFMAEHFVGYNHKSIGDCGTTTLFIEGVSLLAAKALQNTPLYSGQETSTRYLDMGARAIADPVGDHASEAALYELMTFYRKARPRVVDHVNKTFPIRDGEDLGVYEKAVLARTFDILRGFLPAGVTTQLSWHVNLRQAGDHLAMLFYHPLAEVRAIARMIYELLTERYPSSAGSIGKPGVSGIVTDAGEAWRRKVAEKYSYQRVRNGVSADFADLLRDEVDFGSTIHNSELDEYADILADRPPGAVLPHFLADLGQMTFQFVLDFGSWRDLQRHRNGVCRAAPLTMSLGFEPWYLDALPDDLQAHAQHVLLEHSQVVLGGRSLKPLSEMQYVLPIGYRVATSVTYGLPAALYVIELRSKKFVHPTLRKRIQAMAECLAAAHPRVTMHVDRDLNDWDVRRGKQDITRRPS